MVLRFGRVFRSLILFAVLLFGYTYYTDADFDQWKIQFRQEALNAGIEPFVFDMAFRQVKPDGRVLHLDAHQAEFIRPIWDYLDSTVSEDRVRIGRALLISEQALLQEISAEYGVESGYLLAIWGMESSYGNHLGHYSVIRSLASLAYQGRVERRDFWSKQLLAALRLVQAGEIPLVELRGSWAGAIGHTQFMPATLEQYAIDFDGDGLRNLRASLPDALASAAHYLVASGWQAGQRWGQEVQVPDTFDWHLADPDYWQPMSYWVGQHGLRGAQGESLITDVDKLAYLALPAGHRGPAFLIFPNFTVLLKYNNAFNYALALGHLSDQLQGDKPIVAQWPREEQTLTHLERLELQELLSAVGFSTKGIDGLIGVNTRAALRSWQADVGFPPDGYATYEQLQRLRDQTQIKTREMRAASGAERI